MGNKLITDKGKSTLLKIGFTSGNHNGFTYLALGSGDSKASQGGQWDEINGEGYHRVPTTLEQDFDETAKQIAISGVFTEDNYHPSGDGKLIKEIALCNSSRDTNASTYFLFSEVPEIYKNDNISLKYTIIISIE